MTWRLTTGSLADRRVGRRVQILRTAATAFRRRGYHGTSVDDIARALRMTKGSLYYYFRNKEEILYVCHDHSLDLMLGALNAVTSQAISPAEQLRQLLVSFAILMTDELHGIAAMSLDLHALSPALRKRIVAKRDAFDHGVQRLIRTGVERTLFRPRDPKLLTLAIMGAVNWIPRWFDSRGTATPEEIGQTFADYFVAGLLAPGPAPAATGHQEALEPAGLTPKR